MLRVALLTFLEPSSGGVALPRAFLHVGGSSVARHQLTMARALGCDRILCLARELSADLVAVQHAAERAAIQFHVISGPRQIAAQVDPADELVVIADGLLAASGYVSQVLSGRAAVLVQPADSGVEGGFERLDLSHASAGIMVMPGHLVEKLAELPFDCDVASALTRIALQAGVPQVQVPAGFCGGAGWRVVRSEEEAQSLEAGWVRLQLGESRMAAPGPALARLAVLRFGPALLHAGKGGRAVATVSAALVLLALVSGWFGHTVLGMTLCAAAWLMRNAAVLLERVEQETLLRPWSRLPGANLFYWLCDAAIVLLVMWSGPHSVWQEWLGLSFPPLILLLLLRLLVDAAGTSYAALFGDRLTLLAVLIVLALSGLLLPGVKLLTLAIAVAALRLPQLSERLTRL